MKWWLLVLAACGGGESELKLRPDPAKAQPSADLAVYQALADTAQRGDAATLEHFFVAPVTYDGLPFTDATCAARFAARTPIGADRLPAFAQCLTTLSFDVLQDMNLWSLASGPVIVRVDYGITGDKAQITGIGYAHFVGEPDLPRVVSARTKRSSGLTMIWPDDRDKVRLTQQHVPKIVGTFATCFDETGAVMRAPLLESTGLPSYDAKISRALHEYRYVPVSIAGKPISACAAMTFIYSQRPVTPR